MAYIKKIAIIEKCFLWLHKEEENTAPYPNGQNLLRLFQRAPVGFRIVTPKSGRYRPVLGVCEDQRVNERQASTGGIRSNWDMPMWEGGGGMMDIEGRQTKSLRTTNFQRFLGQLWFVITVWLTRLLLRESRKSRLGRFFISAQPQITVDTNTTSILVQRGPRHFTCLILLYLFHFVV